MFYILSHRDSRFPHKHAKDERHHSFKNSHAANKNQRDEKREKVSHLIMEGK